MEVVVTTGAIRRVKLQSNCYHQHTNTQLFTDRMSLLSPDQQFKALKGKIDENTADKKYHAMTELSVPSWPFNIRRFLQLPLHQLLSTMLKQQ